MTHPLSRAPYLSMFLESSDDTIIAKGLDGRIHACNAAAERTFGYERDELLGQPIWLLVPADRRSEENDLLRRIQRGERIDHLETVRVRKDGQRIDVSLTISQVRDDSGEVVGALEIARDITELKRARAVQAHLAAIVQSSEDAIISKDLDGIVQSCNATAERMFGYQAAELVGQSVRILHPPDRQGEEDLILAKMRRGERIDHFETVRIRKDGRRLDISLSVSPIRDSSGAIIGVSKIARDITEQKRLARELGEQEEWFRVTLASIGDGVIAADTQGNVTFLNAQAEILTGWPPHEAAGRPLEEVFHIVHERTRTRVANPAERVLRSGRVVGIGNHVVLASRDGKEYPIADSAAPIRDAQGRTIGVVLIFRDVTDERRSEAALREQREWYETTLQSIGDAVIATDPRGCVTFMNAVAEELTGWRLREARGHDCRDVFRIVNEETRLPETNPVEAVLREGRIVGLANHTVLVAADGSEIPIDDSGAPIRSTNGDVIGAVVVFRDITERRRVEAERRAAAVERERILTAERAAREQAERATRVKDEFVAMVSHELRTPLNAILGWAHLMTQPGIPPDVVGKGVDVIARNTRLQAQLISDLLDVSGIVSGKLRLAVEQVDPAAVIRDAIEAVMPSAQEKRIALRQELTDDVGTVAADSARLQQIIWNLLWNAIKFTPEGGTVTVSLRSARAGVEITVSDTGLGIPPDALPHIFERFHQGSASTSRRFGGLGLGLSIVKYLVQLHGGSVHAASEGEGRGATFTVRLPAGDVPRAAERAEPLRESAEEPDTRPLEGIRVLIVEDDADTLDFLSRYLSAHGAEVVTAATAARALTLLPTSDADILVSDIGLPEMDGYELMQRIRRSDSGARAGIPAVALTAYARPEDRSRAFRAGFQAYLAKPVEPPELADTIARFATRSPSRASG